MCIGLGLVPLGFTAGKVMIHVCKDTADEPMNKFRERVTLVTFVRIDRFCQAEEVQLIQIVHVNIHQRKQGHLKVHLGDTIVPCPLIEPSLQHDSLGIIHGTKFGRVQALHIEHSDEFVYCGRSINQTGERSAG